jgi:hypothetical protein
MISYNGWIDMSTGKWKARLGILDEEEELLMEEVLVAVVRRRRQQQQQV